MQQLTPTGLTCSTDTCSCGPQQGKGGPQRREEATQPQQPAQDTDRSPAPQQARPEDHRKTHGAGAQHPPQKQPQQMTSRSGKEPSIPCSSAGAGGNCPLALPARAASHTGGASALARPRLWHVGRHNTHRRLHAGATVLEQPAQGGLCERGRRADRPCRTHMGVNVAFALLPWGAITNNKPEKWLATAVVRDSQAAHMQPGDAFLLEWQPDTKRWMLGRLQTRVARQYYYDWAFQQNAPPPQRGPPFGATYPPGQWERMAIELIPRPAAAWRHQQSENRGMPGNNTHSPAPPPQSGRSGHRPR